MLLVQPNSKQIRNDVFKRILGGAQQSDSVQNVANRIVDELSTNLILVDDPDERRRVVLDTYRKIQNVHKVRQFNYRYASAERNQFVIRTINEILYRFKARYARYF